jgi:hypothetical protein
MGRLWRRAALGRKHTGRTAQNDQVSHLPANRLIFHNVLTMTRALQLLIGEGHEIDEEALACLSPYQTEHINRFGDI